MGNLNTVLRKILFLVAIMAYALNAKAQVSASFTASPTSGCADLLSVFDANASSGTIVAYEWEIRDAANGNFVAAFTRTTPDATFSFPAGRYSICLTVRDANGASNQSCRTNYIFSSAPPIAALNVSRTTSCAGVPITFSDGSTPGGSRIVSWQWDFGDGGVGSTSQSVQRSYNDALNSPYSPTLIVTDSLGCTDFVTRNNLINITARPVAAFTANVPASSCVPPVIVSFINNSSSPSGNSLNYSWNFGDPNPTPPASNTSTLSNPTYNYNRVGNYIITLIARDPINTCSDTLISTSSVVIGSPLVVASTTQSSACAGEPVQFTSQISGGTNVTNLRWTFNPGGITSTDPNPVIVFPVAGSITATLSAEVDGCAGANTIATPIIIKAAPTVTASSGQLLGCTVPFTTSVTGSSTGTPAATTYNWSFGDPTSGSNTAFTRIASHTYNQFGTYTMVLSGTATNGCADTAQLVVRLEPVSATFVNTPLNGCGPVTATFTQTANSIVPVTQTNWSFITQPGATPLASNTATGNTLNNIVMGPGCYSVVMTVTNQLGCTATSRNDSICFGRQLPISFTFSPSSACARDTITFTANIAPPVPVWYNRLQWRFGDGQIGSGYTTTVTFNEIGPLENCLQVTQYGCDTIYCHPDSVYINGPIASFNVRYDCDPDSNYTANFVNTTVSANRYHWIFGTGRPEDTSNLKDPVFDYRPFGRGTYSVTLTAYNDTTGCEYTYTRNVNIVEAVAGFSVTQNMGCAPFTLPILNTSIDAVNYQWSVTGGNVTAGGATPTLVLPTPGVYTPVLLTVTDSHGCTSSFTFSPAISVSGVTANFAVSNAVGCAPLTVTYSNASSTTFGNVNTWAWDFGANASPPSSTVPNGTVEFVTPGSYPITLVATNDLGCSATATIPSIVQATRPVPRFSATASCTLRPVSISNTTTGTAPLSYSWSFTGGTTTLSELTATNPTVSYPSDAAYTITLVATDGNGCTAATSSTVTLVTPVANFTVSDTLSRCPTNPPFIVSFGNQSTPNIPGVNYAWNFGNGVRSPVRNPPARPFLVPGVYNVSLVVSTVPGCASTATQRITVQGPTGNFRAPMPTRACKPFSNSYIFDYQESDSLIFVGGDGGSRGIGIRGTRNGTVTVTYNFTGVGCFTPSIVCVNDAGCSVTRPATRICIDNIDPINFVASDSLLCGNECISFASTITSNVAAPTITWTFAGATPGTSTARQPSNICYNNLPSGLYNVTLSATAGVCSATLVKQIRVSANPVAAFVVTPTSGCQPMTATVTNNTTSADPIASYAWDYTSDGTVDHTTSSPPPITYPQAGNFNTSLVVSTTFGCTASAIQTVTVTPVPVPTITGTTVICNGGSTTLFAGSSLAGASFSWSNGGPTGTTATSFAVSPTTTTTYTVTVTSPDGCQATSTATVRVNALPTTNLGSNLSACENTVLTITANSSNGLAPYTYAWSTGLTGSANSTTITAVLPNVNVTVTVTDANGCTGTDDVLVNTFALPLASVTASAASVCSGFSSVLTANGSGTLAPYSYRWSNGVPNANNPIVTTGNDVANSYDVTVTDSNGCTATSTGSVFAFSLPRVNAGPDIELCRNDSYTIRPVYTSSYNIVNYTWTPANASIVGANTANPIVTPLVNTTYVVSITDVNGCTATDDIFINVSRFAIPIVSLNGVVRNTLTTTICLNDAFQIFVGSTSPGIDYTSFDWDTRIPGLSCYTNCFNPVATPLDTTIYTVTVTGEGGCRSVATVTVNVQNENFDVLGPDRTVCPGQQVQVTITNGTNPVWSGGGDRSCTNCPDPFLYTQDSATYYVAVRQSGCLVRDTLRLNVFKPNQVTAGPDKEICTRDSVAINGRVFAGGLPVTRLDSVYWSPLEFIRRDSFRLNSLAAVLGRTTDTTVNLVLHTRMDLCWQTDTLALVVRAASTVTTSDVETCEGVNVTLRATGNGDRFTWSPALGLSNTNGDTTVVIAPTANTSYVVESSIGSCPAATATANVVVNMPPILPAYRDYSGFRGLPLVLTVPGIVDSTLYTYAWPSSTPPLLGCFNCYSAVHFVDSNRFFVVTVTDAKGCSSDTEVRVNLLESCGQTLIAVPNAFTPNGDGNNDVFYARSSNIQAVLSFEVFDRWGNQVFTSRTLNNGWNGTIDGNQAPAGVYVYFVDFLCPLDGSRILKKGNVTLIR